MSASFDDVQRIVLHGSPWRVARHLMIRFDGSVLNVLALLLKRHWPTRHGEDRPTVQLSLGFTRQGLVHAGVPEQVMTRVLQKAPAFWAGAQQRASTHLALAGADAPAHWAPCFHQAGLDAVLSLHAESEEVLAPVLREVKALLTEVHPLQEQRPRETGEGLGRPHHVEELPAAAVLDRPGDRPAPSKAGADVQRGSRERTEPSEEAEPPEHWVHFGFRDGLSRIGIRGVTPTHRLLELDATSIHEAGEFVLGHVANSGADRWAFGPPRPTVWPERLRDFFRNGSFGVLHQVEQHVGRFDDFINARVAELKTEAPDEKLDPDAVRAKLCGRTPDGTPLVKGANGPIADFNYDADDRGETCPFGSHTRRMNPRIRRPDDGPHVPAGDARALAHFGQARPLLRRGMPYGAAWTGRDDGVPRGLIGQFFCASIEDQFEHLLAEWADRVPLGSRDGGGARDPLIGAHGLRDGPFEIPRPPRAAPASAPASATASGSGTASSDAPPPSPPPPLHLRGFEPFVRTVGAAYLFYPSLTTLQEIVAGDLWRTDRER